MEQPRVNKKRGRKSSSNSSPEMVQFRQLPPVDEAGPSNLTTGLEGLFARALNVSENVRPASKRRNRRAEPMDTGPTSRQLAMAQRMEEEARRAQEAQERVQRRAQERARQLAIQRAQREAELTAASLQRGQQLGIPVEQARQQILDEVALRRRAERASRRKVRGRRPVAQPVPAVDGMAMEVQEMDQSAPQRRRQRAHQDYGTSMDTGAISRAEERRIAAAQAQQARQERDEARRRAEEQRRQMRQEVREEMPSLLDMFAKLKGGKKKAKDSQKKGMKEKKDKKQK